MANVVDKEAIPSLDYLKNPFAKPSYDARLKDTQYEYYHPVSGTKNCIRWVIPRTTGNRVPNMEKLMCAFDINITNKEKKSIPPVDIKSSVANNFINSMIGTLTISYNNTVVCKINRYPIYNYCRMKLNCDDNDFKTWASNCCFYDKGEEEDLDDIDTKGWKKRRAQFGGPIISPKEILDPTKEDGSKIDNPDLGKFRYNEKPTFFIGKLDTFLETPALLPNVDIHVQLDLSKPEYVFHSDEDATDDINFVIQRARLFLPHLVLSDSLYTQLKNRLAKEPIRQFFTSTQITTHSISTGDKSTVFSNICPGLYPNRCFVLIQETERMDGKFSLNSLKFSRAYNQAKDPFILKSISMKHNRVEVEGLACDDDQGSFRDQYFRLMELTNQNNGKNACSISWAEFCDSSCFLLYDFTASMNLTEQPLLPLVEPGNLRLELSFDRPTTCPLTVLVMAELSTSLTLEHTGKCTLAMI